MLDLMELEQLVAFADYGTLSRAAEALHMSQPSITRAMQRVEEAFGAPLFVRGKNRIALNQTGRLAVKCARELLGAAEDAVSKVRDFDRSLRTIAVESCAPAPLWQLLPALSERFPEKTISSRLVETRSIIDDVRDGRCEIGILPAHAALEGLKCMPMLREELSVCLPPGHALADRKSLTFSMLNGFNCLLRSQIGFWTALCREKMPASRFLVQTDEFELRELIRESSLPCFTTNLVRDTDDALRDRVVIPITDAEANVTYHLLFREDRPQYAALALPGAPAK